MNSREIILGRIRTKLGRNSDNAVTGRAAMDDYLAARKQGPRPRVEGGEVNLVTRFRDKSEAQSSTVEEVSSLAELPSAVASYLLRHALPTQAVCWPELNGLAWQESGLDVASRGVVASDLVGITACFCALAETGSLMLCSSSDTPAALSLLPETHIAIVSARRIVAGMEEAWILARDEFPELPRAVNFISGPSRTGDIEQTIVLGAHGPYRVHIIMVRNY